MNLENFPVERYREIVRELKIERDYLVAKRRARFKANLPYRVWFWMMILFALYLASPF